MEEWKDNPVPRNSVQNIVLMNGEKRVNYTYISVEMETIGARASARESERTNYGLNSLVHEIRDVVDP